MAHDDGSFQRTLQQFLDVWILPEVQRRQDAGLLPTPVSLHAAQVIFHADGRGNEVRLNSEVKAQVAATFKDGVPLEVGSMYSTADLSGLLGIRLPEGEDPDCGHMTMVRVGSSRFLGFDCRYNKGRIREHLEIARQFLDAAEYSASRGNWSAFVDALFSAAELAAKSTLLTLPGMELASHGVIHSEFNRFAHLGNVTPDHRAVFNRLRRLRDPARYLKGKLSITEDEAEYFATRVRDMIQRAEESIAPLRFDEKAVAPSEPRFP